MSVRAKVRGGLVLGIVVLVAYGLAPHLGKGWDPDAKEIPFGPRNPGYNKQYNCRFMSLDVEVTLTGEQKFNGLVVMGGSLNAEFGPPAGNIANERVTVPDYSQSRQYYKREFCSTPGSALSAVVVYDTPVLSSSCYFYQGPDADSDNATKKWQRVKDHGVQTQTWCQGVTP